MTCGRCTREVIRPSYLTLAERFLKKTKKQTKIEQKGKKGGGLDTVTSDSWRGSHTWKKLIFFFFFLNFAVLYLHPQRHPVSRPQFLENSCDVFLWWSAKDKNARINLIQTVAYSRQGLQHKVLLKFYTCIGQEHFSIPCFMYLF